VGQIRSARTLPEFPPAGREKPACGGVQQVPGEDGCGYQQEADGLVAVKEAALGFAAGLTLLLDVIAFELVVHELVVVSRQYSGGGGSAGPVVTWNYEFASWI
jgi:hypothetical protein